MAEFILQAEEFMLPENEYLFQRPKRTARTFKIHDNKTKIYFEDSKCGENIVREMLPTLSEALGIPRLTNCQIRCTAIRNMKRAGIDDRTIMELTRHKRIETLNKYDPLPTNSKKLERSFAIVNPKIGPEKSATVTSAQFHAERARELGQTLVNHQVERPQLSNTVVSSETFTTAQCFRMHL